MNTISTSRTFIIFFLFSMFVILASASENYKNRPAQACKSIKQACEQAGFIKGQYKNGNGLWKHCINPIMKGETTIPGTSKLLPSIDAATISACKAATPRFGMGKIG